MKRIFFIALAAALILTACGRAAVPTPSAQVNSAGAPAAAPEMMYEAPLQAPAPANDAIANSAGSGSTAAGVERIVIQNADLSIVVADPAAKMKAIEQMAENLKGYVVSSNLYQTTTSTNAKVPEGQVTIRVPVEKLDDALDTIKSDVIEVQSETRSGQDVTKDYVDLQSRLKNLEATEAQLVKIMKDANKTEDVLNVFNQLTSIREQIEVVKGQIQYYEESAALSAINVRVIAEESVQPIEVGGWKITGTARNAFQSLIDFAQGFVRFLIWLIILIIPAGLVILGLLWVLWRIFRFAWRKLFPRRAKKKDEELKVTSE
jgi:hypothetical protein